MTTESIIKNIPRSKRERVRDNLNFAAAIKELMERSGLDKITVCNRFGVSPTDRSKFLSGAYPYTKKQKLIFDEYSVNLSQN